MTADLVLWFPDRTSVCTHPWPGRIYNLILLKAWLNPTKLKLSMIWLYWKLISKGPSFVPFGASLNQYGANSNIPVFLIHVLCQINFVDTRDVISPKLCEAKCSENRFKRYFVSVFLMSILFVFRLGAVQWEEQCQGVETGRGSLHELQTLQCRCWLLQVSLI